MKILLFGGSGMLGSAIQAEANKQGHTIIAPTHEEHDVTNPKRGINPADLIINASGTVPYAGYDYSANSIGAFKIAQSAKFWEIPLIHISTDCVFSGKAITWNKIEDVPDPIDLYGVSKRYGELVVQAIYPEALILRTSFIGPQHGLLRWFLDLPKYSKIEGYKQALWSGSSVYEVARRVLALDVKHFSGIQHLATYEPVTKCAVLEMLASKLRPDISIKRVQKPVIHRALAPTILLESLESTLPELIENIG